MADQALIDGFLELEGGSPPIEGETHDAVFGPKGAMGIRSFCLSSAAARLAAKRKEQEEESGMAAPLATSKKAPRQLDSDIPMTSKASGSGGAGKGRQFSLNFEISKDYDTASPRLFQAYCDHFTRTAKPYKLARVT